MTNVGYTDVVNFCTDENGKTYLLNSGDYLVSKENALETIAACQKYLSHINDTDITIFNERLYRDRTSEPAKKSEKVKYSAKERPTVIYLIRNNRNGYHKIGRANNVEYREKTLQSEEPELELIYSFVGSIQDETALHIEFKEKRLRGEWFNLNESDINFIKSNG